MNRNIISSRGAGSRVCALLLAVVLLAGAFTACGRDRDATTPTKGGSASQTDGQIAPHVDPTDLPNAGTTVDPIIDAQAPIPGNHAVTGAPEENAETYTGFAPLPEIVLEVDDPDNTRGLSTKQISHSFGVSKNGESAQTSIDNQVLYGKYGGLTLDTSGEKVLYLTFDCGYENGYTGKILDTLKEKQVPAAFFVTMPYLKDAPELVTRMILEGHVVGNHSNHHPNFSKIDRAKMAQEIQDVDNYLRVHFGYSAPFFRFPEGACSDNALELVQSVGYQSVFWSVAYADWDPAKQSGADHAFQTVTARLHPGAVILLHAVSKDNAEALGRIIDWAQENGYEFKSL